MRITIFVLLLRSAAPECSKSMEFPFGHNHHNHHHHRRDDEEHNRERGEFYPPPAQPYSPPYYGDQPPPPQAAHVYHTSHHGPSYGEMGSYPPPPRVDSDFHDAPRPPPPAAPVPGNAYVEHVSHESHHSNFPSFLHPHSHESYHPESHHPEVANKPTVRVYCKAESNYSLSIRNGKVILARADLSDPFQVSSIIVFPVWRGWLEFFFIDCHKDL